MYNFIYIFYNEGVWRGGGGLKRESLYNQSNLKTDFMADNLEVSSKGTSEKRGRALI